MEQAALDNLPAMLRSPTAHLAESPETQIAYLEGLDTGASADELALEFDDAFRAMERLVAAGMLGPGAADALHKIDGTFADMSGRQELWTFEALREREEWWHVRHLSARALDLLPV